MSALNSAVGNPEGSVRRSAGQERRLKKGREPNLQSLAFAKEKIRQIIFHQEPHQ